MWKTGSQSISSGDGSTNLQAGGSIQVNVFESSKVPADLVDREVLRQISVLKRARFFSDFETKAFAQRLSEALTTGNLSGGTASDRGVALAWCARILSTVNDSDQADVILEEAERLGANSEHEIARAFLVSRSGEEHKALALLAKVDSAAARSAALIIVNHHRGRVGSVDWLQAAGLGPDALDADGKAFLLSQYLQLEKWDQALQLTHGLQEKEFDQAPCLYQLVAVTQLVNAVADEFRPSVVSQVPFDAHEFPLASDDDALAHRREAHALFVKAAVAAECLGCIRSEKLFDEYALWLELRDPLTAKQGRERLESKLRDPKSSLGYVHFGLQFGVTLDLDAVEKEIEIAIALNGGATLDVALARFAIAFTQKSAEAVAEYLEKHEAQLAEFLSLKLLQLRRTEMLVQAGRVADAKNLIAKLVESGSVVEEEDALNRLVAEAEGSDPVELRIKQWRASGSLADLMNLVGELESRSNWEKICEFGEQLFHQTREIRDAVRLATAYLNAGKSQDLVDFLKDNPAYLPQSDRLQLLHAWALYNEGHILEANDAFLTLQMDDQDSNLRALRVNLAITSGNWNSLSDYVANEYRNRNARSAEELLATARLALHLGSVHSKELVQAAAAAAPNDAQVLASCYLLATGAGWEDDAGAPNWLQQAVGLSDENGPLRPMNLREVLEQKPEWDRKESEAWQMLQKGEVPLFAVGQLLNRSLVEIAVLPAWANLREKDPRRRGVIPAFSGKRLVSPIQLEGDTCFSATTLFTLSFLKVLGRSLDAFSAVYIPHSTLGWLFEERRRAVFHQPSRIKRAQGLVRALSNGSVERFAPTAVADSELATQIGDELAALIAQAEHAGTNDTSGHIVVRPYPVHRLSTLMEEEVDLSMHEAVLSSCQAVIEKLRMCGQVTAQEEEFARAYLQVHEQPWPKQPEIPDGATIYLDDLTVSHFQHLGLLDRLEAAGLTAIVSQREIDEANALLAYEGLSDDVLKQIEIVRSELGSRIESGKVKVGPRRPLDEKDESSVSSHPTVDLFSVMPRCSTAVSDDRFINQHLRIDSGSGADPTPLHTSLDLLEALHIGKAISHQEYLEFRTRLRRAGFLFMPIEESEICGHLAASAVIEGRLSETAELKAIREYLLKIKMTTWLQLPNELAWLDSTLKVLIQALKSLWVDGADIASVMVKSDWLDDLIDVRGWACQFGGNDGCSLANEGRRPYILLLLVPPQDVGQDVVEAYWRWVENRVLAPLSRECPALYAELVRFESDRVAEISKLNIGLENNNE